MKKVLLVILALLVSVAFVTTVFAQEKAQDVTTGAAGIPVKIGPGAKDTGAPSVTKAGPAASAGAAKVMVFKGEVVSVDAAAKTLVVKDKKGEKTFDYSNVKKMAELKAGDKVSLQYAEKDGKLWAANVQKAGAKAPPKGEGAAISTGAQAGSAQTAPAKPAPAPAPAK